MQRCNHCGASWEMNTFVNRCPFCDAILTEIESPIRSIDDAFSTIIKNHGAEVFLQGDRFLGLLADYAPFLIRERKLVRIAVDSGAYKALYESADSEREATYNRYVNILTDSFFLDDYWARTVLLWCYNSISPSKSKNTHIKSPLNSQPRRINTSIDNTSSEIKKSSDGPSDLLTELYDYSMNRTEVNGESFGKTVPPKTYRQILEERLHQRQQQRISSLSSQHQYKFLKRLHNIINGKKIIDYLGVIFILAIVALVGVFYSNREKYVEKNYTDTTEVNKKEQVNNTDFTETNDKKQELNASAVNLDPSTIKKINDCVLTVREQYTDIQEKISKAEIEAHYLGEYFTVYYEKGGIVSVAVTPGYYDDSYRRFYYYKDGHLFFAYYEATDSHRFYFQDDTLLRWRYCKEALVSSRADVHDLENTEEFHFWQDQVLMESADILEEVISLSD